MNRIRIEASEPTALEVEQELLAMWEYIHAEVGGEWEEEHPLETQTTAKGFWGRWTLRLKENDDGGS
jgi:hypothetical protein